MEFYAFIPIWIAGNLLYLSHSRQQLLLNPLNKNLSLVGALVLIALSCLLVAARFPLISAMIGSFVVLMALLPAITMLAAYGRLVLIKVSLLSLITIVVLASLNKGGL